MSEFLQDLRYGARVLRRSPGFSAIAALIIALGIGANSAIFSVVNAVLLRPLPYRDPARLYQLNQLNPKGDEMGISLADAAILRQRIPAIESISQNRWRNFTLTGPEGPENVFGAAVSPETFPMLGRNPAQGHTFRPDEFRPGAPASIILSDQLWQRRFARNPAVIGKQLMANGEAYTIAGVMPPGFFLFTQRFELFLPWQPTAEEGSNRDMRFPTVIQVKAGANAEQARTAIESVLRTIAPDEAAKGWRVGATPVLLQLTQRVRPALLVMLGAVGFVLLIVCLNVANLLLARSSDRGREMAVRAALGAGRFRVVRQLLTESLLLAGLGGAAGLVLAWWGSRILVGLFPERSPVPRLDQTQMDGAVLLFSLAVTLLTGIAFGLIPAWQASRMNLNEALKESSRGATRSGRAHRLRDALVIAEAALSLVLLIGAGLMLRSFDRLLRVNPGFNPDRVLTLRVPMPTAIKEHAAQAAYYTRILEVVQNVPGVNSAGLVAPLPLANVDANATFAVEGRPPAPDERQLVKLRLASPAYFRVMGVSARAGRVFQETDTKDAPQVTVINEALARRYFPNEDPLGKRVAFGPKGPWMTICGVVNDVKALDLAAAAQPEMYRDYRQYQFAQFATVVVARTASEDPASVAAVVQRQIRATNPDQPVTDVRSMRQIVADNVAQPRFYTVLLAVFAGLALVLAAAGLYGVLSCSVERRAHEIAIRMALGASQGSIFRQVIGHAALLLAAGVAAGLAGSLALTRLISAQLYQVSPTDPITFAAVSVLLAFVGLAASYLPARRAVTVDPLVTLRCE